MKSKLCFSAIFFFVVALSCKSGDLPSKYTDTLYVSDTSCQRRYDSLVNACDESVRLLEMQMDSINSLNTILYTQRDSLRHQNLRINTIKHYVNICEKNSNLKIYFFGWVKNEGLY